MTYFVDSGQTRDEIVPLCGQLKALESSLDGGRVLLVFGLIGEVSLPFTLVVRHYLSLLLQTILTRGALFMEIATPIHMPHLRTSSTHLWRELEKVGACMMFSLDENWAQSDFIGEAELHRDLFGAVEDEETPSKCKKAKLADNSTSSQAAYESVTLKKKTSGSRRKRTALHSKMASKMEGARFRWINEQLYTTTGHQAKQMFDEDPSLFEIYHTGFATQVSKWPLNPLDKIITYIKSLPPDSVIADFGCGEAKLAQSVSHTVHSFDLVAANSYIIACDMAHVPLAKRSVDVVVFCLSLMGSNVSDFIREARRVLKKGGVLKICEIASRIDSVEDFVGSVESFGFKLIKMDTISKMFLDFKFKATSLAKRGDYTSAPINIHLNPCIYKRR